MKNKFIKLAILLTAIIMVTGCSAKKEKLVVGVMTDVDSIPFVVAMQKGYLPDYVELQIFNSPVDRDAALYSNNLDGTISDVLAVCLAKESEFDVEITSMTQGKYGLIASKDSGIKTVADLASKEIGMSLNTIIEYVADSIVTKDGMDVSVIKKTAVPKMTSRLELLANNQIDAIAVPEPYVTAAIEEGGILLKTSTDLDINPGIMLFTKEATEKKSKEIEEFYKAYDKAVDFINQNVNSKEAYLDDVMSELGLPEAARNVEYPEYTHHVMPKEEEITKAVDWLLEKELIKNTYQYKDLIWDKK